jgi:hypothetical protein
MNADIHQSNEKANVTAGALKESLTMALVFVLGEK